MSRYSFYIKDTVTSHGVGIGIDCRYNLFNESYEMQITERFWNCMVHTLCPSLLAKRWPKVNYKVTDVNKYYRLYWKLKMSRKADQNVWHTTDLSIIFQNNTHNEEDLELWDLVNTKQQAKSTCLGDSVMTWKLAKRTVVKQKYFGIHTMAFSYICILVTAHCINCEYLIPLEFRFLFSYSVLN